MVDSCNFVICVFVELLISVYKKVCFKWVFIKKLLSVSLLICSFVKCFVDFSKWMYSFNVSVF